MDLKCSVLSSSVTLARCLKGLELVVVVALKSLAWETLRFTHLIPWVPSSEVSSLRLVRFRARSHIRDRDLIPSMLSSMSAYANLITSTKRYHRSRMLLARPFNEYEKECGFQCLLLENTGWICYQSHLIPSSVLHLRRMFVRVLAHPVILSVLVL